MNTSMPDTPAPTPDQGGVGADGDALLAISYDWANLSFSRATRERWAVYADGIKVGTIRYRGATFAGLVRALSKAVNTEIMLSLPGMPVDRVTIRRRPSRLPNVDL